MIIHRIKKYVKNSSISFKVKAVRIGLGYTAVSLESGATGVAYTFSPHSSPGCSLFKGKRPLSGKRASELLAYLWSNDRIESAMN